jgi:transcriptional regulator with XRE-family HTH domain
MEICGDKPYLIPRSIAKERFMTPERIKKIRGTLRLTQEDLAIILGVTKTTVWRYEDSRGVPGEDVTARLLSLELSLKDSTERGLLNDLCRTPGGIAAMAAISTLGSTIFSRSTGIDPIPVGYIELLNFPAGKALFSFLGKICGTSSTKETG